MTYKGSCFCGQVSYTIEAEPLGVRMCWCRDCQKIASGSATVNALFPVDSIAYSGEMTTFEKVADSGNTVERAFCPKCGSQIFSRPKLADTPTRIRVGTLDNPSAFPPTAIIWTDSAPTWAVLDPALPHFPKAP